MAPSHNVQDLVWTDDNLVKKLRMTFQFPQKQPNNCYQTHLHTTKCTKMCLSPRWETHVELVVGLGREATDKKRDEPRTKRYQPLLNYALAHFQNNKWITVFYSSLYVLNCLLCNVCFISCVLYCIILLISRPRRSRSAAAYSDQTIPWTTCRSVHVSVRASARPVHCGKMADRIRMPFGVIGLTDPGTRQIVHAVWGLVHGKGYLWGRIWGAPL